MGQMWLATRDDFLFATYICTAVCLITFFITALNHAWTSLLNTLRPLRADAAIYSSVWQARVGTVPPPPPPPPRHWESCWGGGCSPESLRDRMCSHRRPLVSLCSLCYLNLVRWGRFAARVSQNPPEWNPVFISPLALSFFFLCLCWSRSAVTTVKIRGSFLLFYF